MYGKNPPENKGLNTFTVQTTISFPCDWSGISQKRHSTGSLLAVHLYAFHGMVTYLEWERVKQINERFYHYILLPFYCPA